MNFDSMGFISWIVSGLIIGAAARLLLPGRDPIGCLATIGLGILGAIVGGYIWTELFKRDNISWIGAIISAMVLLLIFRSFTYRKRRSPFRRRF